MLHEVRETGISSKSSKYSNFETKHHDQFRERKKERGQGKKIYVSIHKKPVRMPLGRRNEGQTWEKIQFSFFFSVTEGMFVSL